MAREDCPRRRLASPNAAEPCGQRGVVGAPSPLGSLKEDTRASLAHGALNLIRGPAWGIGVYVHAFVRETYCTGSVGGETYRGLFPKTSV